ncbi:MAG TPA: DUF6491 family protein [Caulobacteraceae bacterium]|nr:DUF6491 family protein [Caulobacteraceae bacterium]
MLKHLFAAVLGATALGVTAAPALAQGNQCFVTTEWNGWKAPDDHTIYLNVFNHKIYRLDLSSSCPALMWPDARLITHDQSGNGYYCSALDWDLKVGDSHGVKTACIVSKMTLLTPEQAAAIPRKFRP